MSDLTTELQAMIDSGPVSAGDYIGVLRKAIREIENERRLCTLAERELEQLRVTLAAVREWGKSFLGNPEVLTILDRNDTPDE